VLPDEITAFRKLSSAFFQGELVEQNCSYRGSIRALTVAP
jgi:hypothetical protein